MEERLAISRLGALAHPTRLQLFRRLVRKGREGLPAGELAAALAVPNPTLSFHLAALGRAGLVSAARRGRTIRYAADHAAIAALVGYLYEHCCSDREDCCLPVSAPTPIRGGEPGRDP